MSRIPSEIIEQILLQSPAKSLVRFKSVSKEWKTLISDPQFIKTHTHQLLHQPPIKKLVALSKPPRYLYSIELTNENIINGIPATGLILSPMRWSKFLGSCNGLILALDVNDTLFLMNPTTHDLWKLPVNPLAYNTDMCHYRYGFGYDSSTDDYKVVSVYFSFTPEIAYATVSIYSFRNNSWRKLTTQIGYYDGSCALVNGNFHWLPDYSPSIIAFSFVDELFSKIKPPDSILNRNLWSTSAVVEIGGRLGVYLCLKSDDYELWVMQEYGDAKSWTRVFSHEKFRMPVCLVEGSDRDIVSKGICDDAVVVFNMDERRDRKVRIVGGQRKINIIEGTFVESIESIKRINTLAFQLK